MARYYKKRKNKNDIDFHDFQKLDVEGFSFKPESKWRMLFNILLVGAMVAFSILIWL